MGRSPAGLALLRKPAGITSFQALGAVKRALKIKRVGHAGTLDRFASGLLIVLAGSYCRLAAYAEAGEKLYRGTIAFGTETKTLDPEGEVVAEAPRPSRADLESVLPLFLGSILQRPPLFSAVHLDGRRAYERARSGEEPEMPERRVEVRELVLESYEDGAARIRVRCSPGTYIRSLARDLALACGSRAHLVELERLAIGPYGVDEACDPEAFDPGRDLRKIDSRAASGLGLQSLEIDAANVQPFLNGAALAPASFKAISAVSSGVGSAAAVFDPAGELLGIVEFQGQRLSYRAVLGGRETAQS